MTVACKFKKYGLIFIVAAGMGLLPGVSSAGFMDPGWGARGAGKGGAFIASVDDVSAVMWNPAALSEVYMREALLSYHKPYAGLDGVNLNMGFASFAYPVEGIGNFGASFTSFDGDGKYRETTFQVSGAREFSELLNIEPMMLSAGVNLKYLLSRYYWDSEIKALGDPVTEKDGAGAFTADIGVLFQPSYSIPVGITVKNIIPADVGLAGEDIVPLEFKAGAAYRLGTVRGVESLTPEIMVGYRDHEYDDGKVSWAVGVEGWVLDHTLGLRAGINDNEGALGASFEKFIGDFILRIDYAVLISSTLGDNLGSHRISTNLRF